MMSTGTTNKLGYARMVSIGTNNIIHDLEKHYRSLPLALCVQLPYTTVCEYVKNNEEAKAIIQMNLFLESNILTDAESLPIRLAVRILESSLRKSINTFD
jgi:hypothetical protein